MSLEDSWPKQLEHFLRQRGVTAEVINLGQPGLNPMAYADTAERAIPLFRPQLVILGVLQGDDLAQSAPTEAASAGVRVGNGTDAPPRELIARARCFPTSHVWPRGWRRSRSRVSG